MNLTPVIVRLKRAERAYGGTQERPIPGDHTGSLLPDSEFFMKHTCGYVGGGDLCPRWENQGDHGGN
jgi:hypothetical protein